MPIYEYDCSKCGNTFEVLQDKNVTKEKCPSCGGVSKKKMSVAGFVFKGSGFYVNDYKGKSEQGGKNSKQETPKDSGAKPAENKTETKSDSKPETKTENKPEAKTETAKPAIKKQESAPKSKSTKNQASSTK